MPIISVETQAPDARRAAALADASVAVLKTHLASVAGLDDVPAARRVVIRQLDPASASVERRGPGPALAIVASLMIFLLACGTLLALSWLVRVWRNGPELEATAAQDAVFVDWEEELAEDEDRETPVLKQRA